MHLSAICRTPSRRTVLLACLVPLLLLCGCLALFQVDVPFWDEWTILGNMLLNLKEGSLDLAALAAQQNEQRNLAARVFSLALMPLCGLNRLCEHGVMVLMLCGVFLLLVRMWRRDREELGLSRGAWLPLGFAALTFSVQQWQLFAFGANTSITMLVLCLAAGAALLQRGRLEVWRVLLAALVGWAGSFHFANGLFYWICLIPLFFVGQASPRRRGLALGFFLLAGASAWLTYFHGYVKPPHHPPLLEALAHPVSFVGYFFAYLGTPLVADANLLPLALAVGFLGCCYMGLTVLRLLRQDQAMLQILAPWLCLALFALMSDGATAVGRAGFGMHQAMQSRYIPFSNFFWFALLVVWALGRARLRPSAAPQAAGQPRGFAGFMSGSLALYLLGAVLAVIVFANRHQELQAARNELYSLTRDAPLEEVFPDPNYLRKIVPLFFEPRLSMYREVRRLRDYEPLPLPLSQGEGAAGAVTDVEPVPPGGKLPSGVLLRGRATDPTSSGAPASLVCFVHAGKIVFAALPDKDGTFEAFLPSGWFPGEGVRTVRIMPLAVLADGEHAAFLEIPGNGAVTLPPSWYPEFVIDDYFFSPRAASGRKLLHD